MSNILIPDFLRDIISQCEFTVPVVSAVFDPTSNTTVFNVCKTYHATVKSPIVVGPDEYEIIDVVNNTSLTFSGDLSAITEFNIPAPFFWQGTPLQVQQTFSNITDWRKKLPMIWLIEPYVSYNHEGQKSKLAYDCEFTLLFALPQLNRDEVVEEQYISLIYPLDNLLTEFRELIRKSPLVENFNNTSKTINRVNMGEWVSKGGARKPLEDNIKKLLDELITAVEYSPSFSIKKTLGCCKPAVKVEPKVIAIVENTDATQLATKLVSISDNIIQIPNIDFTNSDGVVTSEPAGVDLVCDAQIKDLELVIPYFDGDGLISISILEPGTLTSATFSGLTNVNYSLNAAPAAFPFAVVLPDTLEITFDAAPADGVFILNGSYV